MPVSSLGYTGHRGGVSLWGFPLWILYLCVAPPRVTTEIALLPGEKRLEPRGWMAIAKGSPEEGGARGPLATIFRDTRGGDEFRELLSGADGDLKRLNGRLLVQISIGLTFHADICGR